MQNEEKTKTTDEIDGRKTKNLYNVLVRDQKSVFYATDKITNKSRNRKLLAKKMLQFYQGIKKKRTG